MDVWILRTVPASATASAGTANPSGDLTMNLPAVIAAGDLLVFYVTHDGVDWLTPPAGWTLGARDISSGSRTEGYWRRADGSEGATITVQCPQAPIMGGQAAGYENLLVAASPFVDAVTQANASGVSTGPTLADVPRNALVVPAVGFAIQATVSGSTFVSTELSASNWTSLSNISGNAVSDLYGPGTFGQSTRMSETIVEETGAFSWTPTSASATVFLAMAFAPGDPPPSAPTNRTAETATPLGDFPASVTQDAHDDGVTYDLWYSFVADRNGVASVWGNGGYGASTYEPVMRVYTGPADDPVAYLGLAADNEPAYFPVTFGETYYLEFRTNTGNPTPAVLSIETEYHVPQSAPIGSIGINDDNDDFPLAVLSTTDDGVTLQYHTAETYAAGEAGDVLPNGRLLILVGGPLAGAKLYDADYLELASPLAGESCGALTSNATDLFYVAVTTTGDWIVHTVTGAGVVGGTTFNLGSSAVRCMAVSHDDAILYYRNAATNAIRRWDLNTNMALSDLVNPGASFNNTLKDMLCLADGTVLYGSASGADVVVRRYDPSGSLLNTYTIAVGATPAANRLARGTDDETSFWVWKKTGNPSVFTEVRVSDGVVLTTREHGLYQDGAYDGAVSNPADVYLLGSSDSCPFWLTRTESVALGTIIVNKIVVPSNDPETFTFTAGGGLSPGSFSLGHGDHQTFNDVTAGDGYSVAETAKPNYVTTVEVSNGSQIDNLTVDVGETVIVTFTNTGPYQPVFDIEEDPRRWLRRAPIMSSENRRVFYNLFALDCQVGVGQASGAPEDVDPQVMMRWSNDSGHTWSNELWRSMGRIGKYSTLLQWWRLGVGRNRVFEVSGSAAVRVVLLDGYCDIDPSEDAPKG